MAPHPLFEELDHQVTPLGELTLWRRRVISLDYEEVYEVKLGGDYLMSSLFTKVEEELAHRGIAALSGKFDEAAGYDVVVGGLGLGYTARAALQHNNVRSLLVVDYLKPVIEWHEKGLVPLGKELAADERCRFIHGDFFQLALAPSGEPTFDPLDPARRFHAILLDIDHSPKHLLHKRHGDFYQPAGLEKMAYKLHPGGVFALWSDDPPDSDFMDALSQVFASCEEHVISFYNPLQERDYRSTVYVARLSA